MRVSVVIPTMNEADNLLWLMPKLECLRQQTSDIEVIFVDAGSTDGTLGVLNGWGATVVQQTRKGKGNALVCGFAAATGEAIVMMDADGSHHPVEVLRMAYELRQGVEFVKGSRFRLGGGSTDFTATRRLGARVLTGVHNHLFGTRHTDLCYGLMGFTKGALSRLTHLPTPEGDEPQWGDGFEIETLINCGMALTGADTMEVPSNERARRYGHSNLRPVRDGTRVLLTMLREGRRSIPHTQLKEVTP